MRAPVTEPWESASCIPCVTETLDSDKHISNCRDKEGIRTNSKRQTSEVSGYSLVQMTSGKMLLLPHLPHILTDTDLHYSTGYLILNQLQ